VRIGTWNCRMALDRKADAARSLRADVLVVPEVGSDPSLAREPGASFAWRGTGRHKGLGVFGFGGWQVEEAGPGEPWELPVRVIAPTGVEALHVLAVWTVQARGRPTYSGQLKRTIQDRADALRSGRWLLAGDLNASAPDPRHLANVESLHRLGMRSAYHELHGVPHGEETDPTLRWSARGGAHRTYHCDLVLASAALVPALRRVEVGTFRDWVETGLSDHAPVVVTLAAETR
jgi:endonuclease/exonuclease/phosphatase family metal-dependent hydrolase